MFVPPVNIAPTVLLVFSRSAAADAAAKPLIFNGQAAQNKQAAALLIRHTRQVVRQSGLPFVVFSEAQQRGNTFGERLAHAYETLFAQGYQRVIAIGNDCPSLQPADLTLAAAQLEQHPLVLGPAADGGVWLLGVQNSAYSRRDFLSVDWQTPLVLTELLALSGGSVYLLRVLRDVDSAADLTRAAQARDVAFLLKNNLLRVLAPRQRAFCTHLAPAVAAWRMAAFALRGPPHTR